MNRLQRSRDRYRRHAWRATKSTRTKFVAVFGPGGRGRIMSTIAGSEDEARREFHRQLSRRGREDVYTRWVEDGEQIIKEGAKAVGRGDLPRLRYFGKPDRQGHYYASDGFFDKDTGAQRFDTEYYLTEERPGAWEIRVDIDEYGSTIDPEYGDDIADSYTERLRGFGSPEEGEKGLIAWIRRFERKEAVER